MANRPRVLAPSTMTSRWLLQFSMDWRTYLVYKIPDRNIITIALNVSVAWKCYSRQVSLASGFHDTSLQSNTKWDYMSDAVYVCILNEWISTSDQICADNYNYFQFKSKSNGRSVNWQMYLYDDKNMAAFIAQSGDEAHHL